MTNEKYLYRANHMKKIHVNIIQQLTVNRHQLHDTHVKKIVYLQLVVCLHFFKKYIYVTSHNYSTRLTENHYVNSKF
jgi:hypothetical protein